MTNNEISDVWQTNHQTSRGKSKNNNNDSSYDLETDQNEKEEHHLRSTTWALFLKFLWKYFSGANLERAVKCLLCLVPCMCLSFSSSVASHLNFSSACAIIFVCFVWLGPPYVCGAPLIGLSILFGFFTAAGIATACWAVGLLLSDDLYKTIAMFSVFVCSCFILIPAMQVGHFSALTRPTASVIAIFTEVYLLMGEPTIRKGVSFSCDNSTATAANQYLKDVGIPPDDWTRKILQTITTEITAAVELGVDHVIESNFTFPNDIGDVSHNLKGFANQICYTSYQPTNESICFYIPPGTWYIKTAWVSYGAMGLFIPSLTVLAISIGFYALYLLIFPQRYASHYLRENVVFVTQQLREVLRGVSFKTGLANALLSDDNPEPSEVCQQSRDLGIDKHTAAIREALGLKFYAGKTPTKERSTLSPSSSIKLRKHDRTTTRLANAVYGRLEDQMLAIGGGNTDMAAAVRSCSSVLSEIEYLPALSAMEISLDNPGPFTASYAELAAVLTVLRKVCAHSMSAWESTTTASDLCNGRSYLAVFLLPDDQTGVQNAYVNQIDKQKVRFNPHARAAGRRLSGAVAWNTKIPRRQESLVSQTLKKLEGQSPKISFHANNIPLIKEDLNAIETLPVGDSKEALDDDNNNNNNSIEFNNSSPVLKGVLKNKHEVENSSSKRKEKERRNSNTALSNQVGHLLNQATIASSTALNLCSLIYSTPLSRKKGACGWDVLQKLRTDLDSKKIELLTIREKLDTLLQNADVFLRDSRMRSIKFSLAAHSAIADFKTFAIQSTVELIDATNSYVVSGTTPSMSGFVQSLFGFFLPVVAVFNSLVVAFWIFCRPWRWNWHGKADNLWEDISWYRRREVRFGIQFVFGFGVITAIPMWAHKYADFEIMNMPEINMFWRQYVDPSGTVTSSSVSSFCCVGFITSLSLTCEATMHKAWIRVVGVFIGSLISYVGMLICGKNVAGIISYVCCLISLSIFFCASPKTGDLYRHPRVGGIIQIAIFQLMEVMTEYSNEGSIWATISEKAAAHFVGIGTAVVVSHLIFPCSVNAACPKTIKTNVQSIIASFLFYGRAAVLSGSDTVEGRAQMLAQGDKCMYQAQEQYQLLRKLLEDSEGLDKGIPPWRIDPMYLHVVEHLQTMMLVVTAYRDEIVDMYPFVERISCPEIHLWLSSLNRLAEYAGDAYNHRGNASRAKWTFRSGKSALMCANDAMEKFSEELEEMQHFEQAVADIYEQVLLACMFSQNSVINGDEFEGEGEDEDEIRHSRLWGWLTTVGTLQKLELELVYLIGKCADGTTNKDERRGTGHLKNAIHHFHESGKSESGEDDKFKIDRQTTTEN